MGFFKKNSGTHRDTGISDLEQAFDSYYEIKDRVHSRLTVLTSRRGESDLALQESLKTYNEILTQITINSSAEQVRQVTQDLLTLEQNLDKLY